MITEIDVVAAGGVGAYSSRISGKSASSSPDYPGKAAEDEQQGKSSAYGTKNAGNALKHKTLVCSRNNSRRASMAGTR